MDSLEARLKFIEVIKTLHKTLNVSKDTNPLTGQSSATDPVHFYLLHYGDHFEDFHRCIFEVASSMDSLERMNVLIYWSQLLSSLWPRCLKQIDGQFNIAGKVVHDYLIKDLNKMIELVMPIKDWKALSNLRIVTEVFMNILQLIGTKDTYDLSQLTCPRDNFTLNDSLKIAIEEGSIDVPWLQASQSCDESILDCIDLLVDRRAKAIFLQNYFSTHGVISSNISTSTTSILHRMENDRERHKKSKEHLWVTEREISMLEVAEFDALWNSSIRGMTRDDYKDINRLRDIAHASYLYNPSTKP